MDNRNNFIILLISFPKQIFFLILGLGLLFWIYIDNSKKEAKKRDIERAKVIISVKYDLSRCSKKYPLLIYIKNTGTKIINKVNWNIEAYRKGYSSNVVTNSYLQNYSTDKILSYNQSISNCWVLPNINNNLNPSTLEYKISNKWIQH